MIKIGETHALRLIDVDLLNARTKAGDLRCISSMERDDTEAVKRLVEAVPAFKDAVGLAVVALNGDAFTAQAAFVALAIAEDKLDAALAPFTETEEVR